MSEGVLDGRACGARRGRTRTRALEVLDANWLGHGTQPSRLYPHQWSWDSACIAMGHARWNQARRSRAPLALRGPVGERPPAAHRLRDGQRTLLPGAGVLAVRGPPTRRGGHLASSSRRSTRRRRCASMSCRETARRRSRSSKSLRRSSAHGTRVPLPRADAGRRRARRDLAPVGVRHGQLAALGRGARRINPTADEIPDYQRVDVELADPRSVRPTVSTTGTSTSSGSSASSTTTRTGSRTRRRSHFSRCSSTRFSSRRTATWRRSRGCSATTRPPRGWARLTAAGIDAKLWSEEDALYVDYDLERRGTSAPGPRPVCSAPRRIPTAERAPQMVGEARRVPRRGQRRGELGGHEPRTDDLGFLPTRYWRGPIWPILNWALQRGLDRYGYGRSPPRFVEH